MGTINRTEATRLARRCLPKIKHESSDGALETISDGTIETVSENNVTITSLCRLWAGMGYIYQVTITLPTKKFFIVKRVIPPPIKSRSFGDERKAKSYTIEAKFYEYIAPTLIEKGLSIPVPYYIERDANDQITICMSRLEGSPGYLEESNIYAVLTWLATLHAATWGPIVDEYVNQGLVQSIGSYWHLDTRPDEHDSMPRRGWEGRLKLAARTIDERLKRDKMQCCIHGDAKDANMLFYESGDGGEGGVSMYDFLY